MTEAVSDNSDRPARTWLVRNVGDNRSDEDLLAACRNDPDSFEPFYDRHFNEVLGYFYRRTLCANTAAELTAEAFAQAWLSHRRFNPARGSGIGWLFGICKNLHRRYVQREAMSSKLRDKLRFRQPLLEPIDLDRIEDLIDFEAVRADLLAAVDALSPTLREAVMLRVAHERSYEHIAETLGCSPGAARVRVSRGLAQLFDLMEPDR